LSYTGNGIVIARQSVTVPVTCSSAVPLSPNPAIRRRYPPATTYEGVR